MISNLTPKQEKFCQCIAKGMSQSDAYRESYDAEECMDKSIWELASKLASDAKVKSRIDQLTQDNCAFLKYDAKAHYDELEQLKQIALTPMGKDGNVDVKAALKASELKGKLTGLYTERSEVKLISPDNILKEIENESTNTETKE